MFNLYEGVYRFRRVVGGVGISMSRGRGLVKNGKIVNANSDDFARMAAVA